MGLSENGVYPKNIVLTWSFMMINHDKSWQTMINHDKLLDFDGFWGTLFSEKPKSLDRPSLSAARLEDSARTWAT
jgi:hypothetical protein